MDAIKHFSIAGVEMFMKSVREQTGVPLFGVGASCQSRSRTVVDCRAQASTGRTLSRLLMDTSTSSELNSASLTRRKRLCFRSVQQKDQLLADRLHYNFVEAASGGSNFDLRKIFDGSLVQYRPQDAVTLVNNHE